MTEMSKLLVLLDVRYGLRSRYARWQDSRFVTGRGHSDYFKITWTNGVALIISGIVESVSAVKYSSARFLFSFYHAVNMIAWFIVYLKMYLQKYWLYAYGIEWIDGCVGWIIGKDIEEKSDHGLF
jgi:hypothetical protein